ncbi:glutathione S-transferase omega-1 [Amia ocellicauda]|uniref:glutathione S-transferase omega-1 n=1 Tax=Amia ocellicauda TaxID=2972642 RepID=UPI003464614C|nr:GSTO1 transferase [Amia calva]
MEPTAKCVGKGSPAPGAVPEGKLRLYSMRFCPYAQRTRLILHAKGVQHEIVNINLKDKPDWFLEKNPLGLVPVLETPSGQVISESPITCDYLDEAYPGKKLLPKDPYEKAQQKMLQEQFSKVTSYFYKIPMARKNGEDVSVLEEELKTHLVKFNEILVKRKIKFFGGDSVSMIDYMIWPWFERMESLSLQLCLDSIPELKSWTERMLQDPSVKASIIDSDTYKAFYKTYIDGKPNYDYGL